LCRSELLIVHALGNFGASGHPEPQQVSIGHAGCEKMLIC
jgi:hypothetical protein